MSEDIDVLNVAEDLELPADVITQRLAIIGRTGSGKTSTGVVLAEEMIRAHLPVVILDPLGVWHGLRSNAAGDGPGLPVVIFGGDHADLPLPSGSGQLVAEVIVEQRPAAVIDLSGLDSDAEIRRWCAAFLKQIYRLNRNPLHVIVDEADLLAPQQGSGEAAHSLSATKSVARRGRVRGLGLTLITQRPASLAKEVLNQAKLLVAMQLTGPRDVAAVDDWMSQAGDEATVREVRASLPSLKVGESWWWSPSWLRLLQRVQVRPRDTFDSSRTPRPGETRVEPTATASVDLEALAARLDAVIDDTGAGDDPSALRRRVADLERQLRDRPAAQPERVEVPVVLDEDLQAARAVVDELRRLTETLTAALGQVDPDARTPRPLPRTAAALEPDRPAATPRPPRAHPAGTGASGLPRAQRAILHVLVQHPGPRTAQQVAILSGYSAKGGGFANALGALRTAGLVEGPRERLIATSAGVERAGDVPPLPTGPELLEHWAAQLPKAPAALLRALVDAARPLTAEELADAAGYTASGGGFANALGRLRTLGLAHGDRTAITASPHLTEEATLPCAS